MENLSTLSDNELIIQTRNGNEAAFSILVYRYDREVLSIASNYFQNSDDAKDIYQEVFIRVYKGLSKFEFRSEFSTWLYRITTNVCLTHKARGKKSNTVSISQGIDEETYEFDIKSPDESGPERKFINKETKSIVQNAVESLSPKQKMVFELKHIHNHKIKEIAKMMDCTEGTVKKYLFLAVQKLQLKLKGVVV